MFIAPVHTPEVHRHVLRFRRRLLVDRQNLGYGGFDFHSGIKGFANSTARALIHGRAEQLYPASLGIASKVLGIDVIGCGEESLVTRAGSSLAIPGHAVIKYATRPAGDVREIRDVLSRRCDIASRYIGEWITPTCFDIGRLDRADSEPSLVIMTQPHVPIDSEDYTVHPDLGAFCEGALALGRDHGLTFDLTPGAGNLVIATDGRLQHIDTAYTSEEQDGKPGLLSPNLLDSKVNIRKLEEVLATAA